MAAFRTHLISGIVLGGSVGTISITLSEDIRLAEAGAFTILGTIGALLPDIDSDTGKPLELLFQWLSIIVPTMCLKWVQPFIGYDIPELLCYIILSYLFINHIVLISIKKLTAHRGIMHSIPFAILCGEIAWVIFGNERKIFTQYGTLAIFCGCLLHLILDEMHSISFDDGRPVLNRASGSALTFTSPHILSTVAIYSLMIITSVYILLDTFAQDALMDLISRFKVFLSTLII